MRRALTSPAPQRLRRTGTASSFTLQSRREPIDHRPSGRTEDEHTMPRTRPTKARRAASGYETLWHGQKNETGLARKLRDILPHPNIPVRMPPTRREKNTTKPWVDNWPWTKTWKSLEIPNRARQCVKWLAENAWSLALTRPTPSDKLVDPDRDATNIAKEPTGKKPASTKPSPGQTSTPAPSAPDKSTEPARPQDPKPTPPDAQPKKPGPFPKNGPPYRVH